MASSTLHQKYDQLDIRSVVSTHRSSTHQSPIGPPSLTSFRSTPFPLSSLRFEVPLSPLYPPSASSPLPLSPFGAPLLPPSFLSPSPFPSPQAFLPPFQPIHRFRYHRCHCHHLVESLWLSYDEHLENQFSSENATDVYPTFYEVLNFLVSSISLSSTKSNVFFYFQSITDTVGQVLSRQLSYRPAIMEFLQFWEIVFNLWQISCQMNGQLEITTH